MRILFAAFLGLLLSPGVVQAGLLEQLGLRKPSTTNATPPAPGLAAPLSQDQLVSGLKEALGKGVRQAVNQLGHDGGFLTNLNVKIPMPEKLQTVERTARALKQDKLADDFVAAMNHAAEQAVPEAASVFGDAIQQMSIGDATAILKGPKDAATQYFRKVTQTNLFEKFLPLVQTATDKAGVTASYKKLMQAASGNQYLGAVGTSFFKAETVDVDAYVTNRAMDGLFKLVADEEQRIRENPVARTSELLQKVFGGGKK